MIHGETVKVFRRVKTGRDAGNSPIFQWVGQDVGNVLVSPGPRTDVTDRTRPDGVKIAWTLHFPKEYPVTLANARISVRGGEPMNVVGDPQHFTAQNTPGKWSMPVEVARVDG